ncbi:MAG: aminotransferase class I/II-fold pyridoxal phosphate-dependent enzyme [Actinobacteria bacterium]|nr:aminotransferase class I/II-fold pyridoxal phosphate-dependent enzyme [Actinomycetota bacterium]
MIDLRSDTVTRPTPEMRRAMADAEVGDDVFGDDPTVNSLQEHVADLLGKEAALFVPTGSMGNQVCLGVLSRPGDEVICESRAHFLHYEGGSVATNLGLVTRPVPGTDGVITADQVGLLIRQRSEHNPGTAVVAMENTHNSAGGKVFPLEAARSLSEVSHAAGASVHIDGARIFNAQAATGTPAREWAALADTITFCFSKGLGAPIGSIVSSTAERIEEGRYVRKRLGGGMRQVGVIAAAARVAVDTGIERLVEDHENARILATGLRQLHEDAVVEEPQTNMVFLNLAPFAVDASEVAERLLSEGVLTLGFPGATMRLVTHRDVDRSDVDTALLAFKRVLRRDET